MLNYSEIKNELSKIIEGEIFDDEETLKKYSRDASLLEVRPSLVVFPKNSEDIKKVVGFVSKNKGANPELSVTVRAAGSCMSGGSLNESIILDVSKYLNKVSVDKDKKEATVQPGAFYRDFEVETLSRGLILPCYTASKNLCALGGMIGNNAAGEKTLQYGKMENFVKEVKMVLSDGQEYIFKPISRVEALAKSHENTAEGEVYEKVLEILDENREVIREAKPKVSKNSAGYYLWNIEHDGMIDLVKVIVGSQGTLGIVTEAKIKLEEVKHQSKLLVIFMKDLSKLGSLVNTILKYKPESLESYDDATLKLAVRFFPEMLAIMKSKMLKIMLGFIPEAFMVLTGGLPKLALIVEFAGNDILEIEKNIKALQKEVIETGFKTRITKDASDAEKYWTIRRESFNLLRKHIKGKRTAPFIDDVCVLPEHLPEFLPKLQKILDESKLVYTIAGHAGNGNFHIIPLMNMKDNKNRALITYVSEKVYNLVQEYHGSITAEHNDGLIRTPYLGKMYSKEILGLFKETKNAFDPQNIFNPGKKVPDPEHTGIGTIEYINGHLARE